MNTKDVYEKVVYAAHKKAILRAASILISKKIVRSDIKKFMKQISNHDKSKLSAEELSAYAAKYVSKNCDPDVWTITWLHHIHVNPHHWEHWVLPYSTGNTVDGCMKMPENYVYEMICDWMSHYDDMNYSTWLYSHIDEMKFHPETRKLIIDITEAIFKQV